MTSAIRQSSTWALVPLKSGEHAKSRLAGVLSPEQRSRLFYAMAERVVRTLLSVRDIASVAIVTASPQVAAFVRDLGATPLMQPADLGMSAALSSALATLRPMHLERVLMIPGDLPLISAAAVEELLSADSGQGIVVVPDRQCSGTNALLCSPPDVIAPQFGGHSFHRHLAAAESAGVHARQLALAELALDLDCSDDLELLRRQADARVTSLLEVLRAPEAYRVLVG